MEGVRYLATRLTIAIEEATHGTGIRPEQDLVRLSIGQAEANIKGFIGGGPDVPPCHLQVKHILARIQ